MQIWLFCVVLMSGIRVRRLGLQGAGRALSIPSGSGPYLSQIQIHCYSQALGRSFANRLSLPSGALAHERGS
jgi:hypothetical protein